MIAVCFARLAAGSPICYATFGGYADGHSYYIAIFGGYADGGNYCTTDWPL